MEFQLDNNTQVLVLAPVEKCINYKWYEDADKIDSRIQLVTPEYVSSDKFPGVIDKGNGMTEGMMLVRHPFIKDTFVDVTKLEDEILHLKLNVLNSIGLKLGAKAISIKCELKNSEKRSLGVDSCASFGATNIEVNIKSEKEKYSNSEYKIDTSNPETEFSIESYNEAVKLAKEYGLYSDGNIHSLLYDRDPNKANPFKGKKTVSVSALSETNEKLDIAVNASYLKSFNFNSNVAHSCVVKHEISLVTEFDFA